MVNADNNNRLQLTTGNRPGSLSGSEFDNRASHGLTLAVNPLQLLFILTDSLLCVTYRNKRNVCSPRHPPITNCGHLYPHPPLSPESLDCPKFRTQLHSYAIVANNRHRQQIVERQRTDCYTNHIFLKHYFYYLWKAVPKLGGGPRRMNKAIAEEGSTRIIIIFIYFLSLNETVPPQIEILLRNLIISILLSVQTTV